MTHIQVLLKHNIVIAELVFNTNDPLIIAETCNEFGYDQIIDATAKQIPLGGLGSAWNGTSFVPKPYPSWTLDNTFHWQPPTRKPDGDYTWDETTYKWIITQLTAKENNPDCTTC